MFIKLDNSVGNNLSNQKEDVWKVKKALQRFGFFDFATERISHGYITRDMHDAVLEYQKDRSLRIDGKLFPEGETEMQMNTDAQDDRDDMPASPPPAVEKEPLPLPEKDI